MRSLEEYLAVSSIEESILKDLAIEGILEEGDLWLLFSRKSKGNRKYKLNITKIMWGPSHEVYSTYIWAEMLSKGYVLVNIDGGSLVISPDGEQYQLSEVGCTCQYFSYTKKNCKHLVFREGELLYRARQLEALSYIK